MRSPRRLLAVVLLCALATWAFAPRPVTILGLAPGSHVPGVTGPEPQRIQRDGQELTVTAAPTGELDLVETEAAPTRAGLLTLDPGDSRPALYFKLGCLIQFTGDIGHYRAGNCDVTLSLDAGGRLQTVTLTAETR